MEHCFWEMREGKLEMEWLQPSRSDLVVGGLAKEMGCTEVRADRADEAEGMGGLKWREDKVREAIAVERKAFLRW